jgi:hypothetical protein
MFYEFLVGTELNEFASLHYRDFVKGIQYIQTMHSGWS